MVHCVSPVSGFTVADGWNCWSCLNGDRPTAGQWLKWSGWLKKAGNKKKDVSPGIANDES
ncbi:Hypothetical protein GbCGDNIH9_5001 [Granulibacter bethesdensis]|uniref:Uncharacterized protein n=1 Tax=Granulibacter bethesdensis TaxID=364410 RepID=A0AAC9P7B6_9PROT|nr:Hypothetical protein GbCGDNIH9_5001 [Granulibacter bethesdensis]APH60813.1 Hypothetical protein GbCGDNIH8_5001 [Granulibacter bethesdensis]